MQSIKDWFARHGSLTMIAVVFALAFILVRTVVNFWLDVSNPNLSVLAEIVGAVISGVIMGLLASVVTLALRRLSPLIKAQSIIRVGPEETRVDIEDIDKTMRLLEEKISNIQEFPHVFLSHSFQDREFAERLAEDLESQGVEVWLLERQMKDGDFIDKRIRQAIDESQWFLVIISPSAVKSDWVSRELAFALQAEKARGRTFVIPILYEGDEVPPALGDRDYIDFRDRTKYQTALRSLAERLIASLRSAAKKETPALLDNALLALERDEIGLDKFQEIAQAFSLAKWLQGDITGWYELWEEVHFGDGLHPTVRAIIEKELEQVRQERRRSGIRPEYEKRLRHLLSPESVE